MIIKLPSLKNYILNPQIQEQLRSLQEQLQAEEKEKVSLLEKLQEAQEQLAKTATQVSYGHVLFLVECYEAYGSNRVLLAVNLCCCL